MESFPTATGSIFTCDISYMKVVFAWVQQRATELERTQKWVKMTKKWDKYFPGEKV